MRWRLPILVAAAVLVPATDAPGHPGGTDEEGCHTCRSNCEKWDETEGERHCHGDSNDDDSGDSSAREGSDDSDDRSSVADQLSERARARVEEVLDGDTLIVELTDGAELQFRVRILGIDCPESSPNPKCRREGENGGASCDEQIPKGKRATRRVRTWVGGDLVRLESGTGDGSFETGDYGRVLAYVRTSNDRDLGLRLVRRGVCDDYGDEYPHPRRERYERAEERRTEDS